MERWGQLPVQLDGSTLTFNRAKCLVYLPKVPTTISAFQSQLVLIRPQQSLDLELKQAELKVAENGTAYRYTIDASRTNVDDLSSVAEAELEMITTERSRTAVSAVPRRTGPDGNK